MRRPTLRLAFPRMITDQRILMANPTLRWQNSANTAEPAAPEQPRSIKISHLRDIQISSNRAPYDARLLNSPMMSIIARPPGLHGLPIFSSGCIQNRVDIRQKFTDDCARVRSYGFNKETPCLPIKMNAQSLGRNISFPIPQHRTTKVEG